MRLSTAGAHCLARTRALECMGEISHLENCPCVSLIVFNSDDRLCCPRSPFLTQLGPGNICLGYSHQQHCSRKDLTQTIVQSIYIAVCVLIFILSAVSTSSSARGRTTAVCVSAYKDSRQLRHVQEVRAKQILGTYNKAHAFFPKVKFVLQHNSRVGEVWKVCGNSSALGGWLPEVAPALAWNDGGIWSAEIALPPGTYSFKCMLRRADGSYIWEAGDNRHLVVPVKERAGHFVMTYHMEARTEPVESIQPQPGKYSLMRPGDRLDLQELPAQEKNGRVLAAARR